MAKLIYIPDKIDPEPPYILDFTRVKHSEIMWIDFDYVSRIVGISRWHRLGRNAWTAKTRYYRMRDPWLNALWQVALRQWPQLKEEAERLNILSVMTIF